MLNVTEAKDKITASLQPVEAIILRLEQAGGHVLAEDIFSPSNLPAFDNSSVDGFAVRAEDLDRASSSMPVRLNVVIDIPAGEPTGLTIQHGEAARIMTGAPVPSGADAVVMVEDTDFQYRSQDTPLPDNVTISKAIQKHENIRPKGSDVVAGEMIMPAGRRLLPQDIGVLAMLGFSFIRVFRKIRVAVLSSGNELISVDAQEEPGKIRESNSYMLSAMIENYEAEVIHLGIAKDNPDSIKELLDMAINHKADMIVSSAGVSVGAFDYVREVVIENGNLNFWKVNMRPGKPLVYGDYKGIPFFGLPGNPVSAFIGFEVFVRPGLDKMSGSTASLRMVHRALLAESVESDGRESYLRAIVKEENGITVARLTGHQGSGNLLSLVRANALLIIPSGVKSLPLNTEVDFWFL